MTRTVLLTIGLALFSVGCSSGTSEGSASDLADADTTDVTQNEGDTPEPSDPPGTCVPGGTPQTLPSTARAYVEMCEPELGVPPQVDCSAGVTIPVSVDGVEVTDLLPNFECDNPGLQAGGCVPGTTIQRVTGRTREGVERPEVVWVHFCRSEDGVSKGRLGTPVWENVFTGAQMIGYNYETGATCFFELNYPVQEQWVGLDESNRASGLLPNYDEPEFDQAFIPGDQCVTCHENDAFIHNPWVDGARLPSNPNEAVLPVLPVNSPYYVVGGSDWDMRTIHIEGNACLACHRIGMATDGLFRSLGFDANQWMPAHDPGSLEEHYAELLDCWENGPESTPGCDWVIPPGGGCEGGVVGADYPYGDPLPGDFDDDDDGEIGFGDDDKDEFDDDDKDDFDEDDECAGGVTPESGSACEGDWLETLCMVDGEYWWCEDGVWSNQDDKE